MDRREFLGNLLVSACAAPFVVKAASLMHRGATETEIRVPFMLLDKPNANGRVYPRSIVEKAWKDCDGVIMGHLGMPEEGGKLHIDRLSHKLNDFSTEYFNDGTTWVTAVVVPLNTPDGRLLQAMLKDHSESVAFRTAGIGTVTAKEDGTFVINDDYKLVSVNAVPADKAA